MNKIWSSDKTQLGVLKAILITKGNINKSCQQLKYKYQTGYFEVDLQFRKI